MELSTSSYSTPIAQLSLDNELPPKMVKNSFIQFDTESLDESIPPIPKFRENPPYYNTYRPSPVPRKLTSVLPLYIEKIGGTEGFEVVMSQIQALKKTSEMCKMTPDQIITLVAEAFGVSL